MAIIINIIILYNELQIVDSGGSVQLECRVSLGPLEDRTVRTLRVRMRDYFFSFSAATTGWYIFLYKFSNATMSLR